MKKPKKKATGISQGDLVKHWGVVKQYVSRLVKDGCPLTSIEDADKWRNETRERQVVRSPNAMPPERPEGSTPTEPPEPEEEFHDELLGLDMTGLEKELKNARKMASSAARRVRDAEKNKSLDSLIGQRQQTYNKAVENYERMEKSVRRERQARAELLTVDQARVATSKMWVPAITLMRKLPRTLAAKVNPGDDVVAEKILAEGIEQVIAEMRRSLTSEPDPEWHLTIFLAAMLRDKGAPATLIRLQEAVIKLTDAMAEEANGS